jgi:fused signal recognition particle receptor
MEKQSFFQRLKNGLSRTRQGWAQRLETLFGSPRLDEDVLASMEEILISADVGVKATEKLLTVARQHYRPTDPRADVEFSSRLQAEIVRMLTPPGWGQSGRSRYSMRPWVVMFVGVNGVGKTTTIGKFAAQEKQNGKRVLLVAADTFRAAAIEQLETWGARIGIDVVKHQRGQDPSGVAFDALRVARKRDVDLVLIDTAGRLHTKAHLLEELKKMCQVVAREQPGAPHEILLVLDASTGQNALQQAKVFKDSLGVTGVVLTKLDGTAKGGVVIAIQEELQLPVQYVGIGEALDDLQPFDPTLFAQALFA